MERLRRISATALQTYLRCREEYRFAYALGYRPHKREHALEFGSAMHAGLEHWWVHRDPEAAVTAAPS